MALTLSAKAPAAVSRYVWTIPGVRSATLAVTSGTVVLDSYQTEGEDVVFFVSGGATGETATIAASAVDGGGATVTETLYVPVRSSANTLGYTGRDIVAFALRKVNAGDMDAEQLEDGLERLSDMLASWSRQGADIGVAWPVEANTAILADDAVISAVKNNLILRLVDRYEFTPSPFVVEEARRGLQLVKATYLPDERGAVDSF